MVHTERNCGRLWLSLEQEPYYVGVYLRAPEFSSVEVPIISEEFLNLLQHPWKGPSFAMGLMGWRRIGETSWTD